MRKTYRYTCALLGLLILIVFAAFLFVSCASSFIYNRDKAFDAYVESFKFYCLLYDKDCSRYVPIVFRTPKSDTEIGSCVTFGNNQRIVFINPKSWAKYDHYERESLIFHELGHCLLDREHADNPHISIMHKYKSERGVYKRSRDAFIYELFHEYKGVE